MPFYSETHDTQAKHRRYTGHTRGTHAIHRQNAWGPLKSTTEMDPDNPFSVREHSGILARKSIFFQNTWYTGRTEAIHRTHTRNTGDTQAKCLRAAKIRNKNAIGFPIFRSGIFPNFIPKIDFIRKHRIHRRNTGDTQDTHAEHKRYTGKMPGNR